MGQERVYTWVNIRCKLGGETGHFWVQINNELKAAKDAHKNLSSEAKFYYKEFSSKDLSDDYDEMHVMDDFTSMAKASQSADQIQIQIKKLESSISAKEFSLKSLSGALLQIAKQGISFAHGGLSACPNGRSVGRETLKNVIWQARNQSMHFEEGNPSSSVLACFQNLENDFGSQFSLIVTPPENLAKHVVSLLGWTKYNQYKKDMQSII